jgi:hypothetical protein
MNTYKGEEVQLCHPPFFTSVYDTGEQTASCPENFLPMERAPQVPTGQKAERALELVSALFSREKALAPAMNQAPVI